MSNTAENQTRKPKGEALETCKATSFFTDSTQQTLVCLKWGFLRGAITRFFGVMCVGRGCEEGCLILL